MATDETHLDRPSVEDIRDAVRTLPEGEITSDDLRSIGVTEEQFAELADADAAEEIAEYNAARAAHQEFHRDVGYDLDYDDCFGL